MYFYGIVMHRNNILKIHGTQQYQGMRNSMERDESMELEVVKKRIQDTEVHLDKIRGCFVGGAVGDALGYAIEFRKEEQILSRYGQRGITEYELDRATGKALISDDTQMTLFTANGLLVGDTRGALRGIRALPRSYVAMSYNDWLKTQNMSYEECKRKPRDYKRITSWLLDVPELFSLRAPGNTCLSALSGRQAGDGHEDSYIKAPLNNSKGCGGIMRVAPLALRYRHLSMDKLDMEGAELAAITHGHSLGYMPAAVLVHIINRIVFAEEKSLKDIVLDAKDTVADLFRGDKHLKELTDIIDLAIELSGNEDDDLDNIHRIGEGWVAEETLGIAIYCALKYQNSFSDGVIAAVNHNGDSDSTGAVTGNILGALLGNSAIEEKWKANLELIDVITEMADDICHGCQMSEYGSYRDRDWERKYIHSHWREEGVTRGVTGDGSF